eukprot:jgi/Botrbrau1/12109/Bobra.0186s0030.1
MPSVVEALKGAQSEIWACQGAAGKLQCAARILRILAVEIAGVGHLIPFGLRAGWLYSQTPSLSSGLTARVRAIKNIRYGDADRNLLDIYIPAGVAGKPVLSGSCPAVLFIHGGTWASGEKWQYAHLGTRIAEAGMIAFVMSYSLYPQAHMPTMAAEVSAALSWVLDHVHSYGGNPKQVSLVGHSAGAHLCALALIQRALGAQQPPFQASLASPLDSRMPSKFVGVAGVYDLAKHYEHEANRGVQHISTLQRAAGGPGNFAHLSPAVIVASAAASALPPGPSHMPYFRVLSFAWSCCGCQNRTRAPGLPLAAKPLWRGVEG